MERFKRESCIQVKVWELFRKWKIQNKLLQLIIAVKIVYWSIQWGFDQKQRTLSLSLREISQKYIPVNLIFAVGKLADFIIKQE